MIKITDWVRPKNDLTESFINVTSQKAVKLISVFRRKIASKNLVGDFFNEGFFL